MPIRNQYKRNSDKSRWRKTYKMAIQSCHGNVDGAYLKIADGFLSKPLIQYLVCSRAFSIRTLGFKWQGIAIESTFTRRLVQLPCWGVGGRGGGIAAKKWMGFKWKKIVKEMGCIGKRCYWQFLHSSCSTKERINRHTGGGGCLLQHSRRQLKIFVIAIIVFLLYFVNLIGSNVTTLP